MSNKPCSDRSLEVLLQSQAASTLEYVPFLAIIRLIAKEKNKSLPADMARDMTQ